MSDLPPIDRPVVMSSGGGDRRGRPVKPNAATVAEIFLVVGAVWSLAWSIAAGAAYIVSLSFICCLPIPLFIFIVAVFALVDGTRMLLGSHRGKPRTYGLLFLLTALQCDILTFLCGIAILVLCDTPSGREWYGYDRLADKLR